MDPMNVSRFAGLERVEVYGVSPMDFPGGFVAFMIVLMFLFILVWDFDFDFAAVGFVLGCMANLRISRIGEYVMDALMILRVVISPIFSISVIIAAPFFLGWCFSTIWKIWHEQGSERVLDKYGIDVSFLAKDHIGLREYNLTRSYEEALQIYREDLLDRNREAALNLDRIAMAVLRDLKSRDFQEEIDQLYRSVDDAVDEIGSVSEWIDAGKRYWEYVRELYGSWRLIVRGDVRYELERWFGEMEDGLRDLDGVSIYNVQGLVCTYWENIRHQIRYTDLYLGDSEVVRYKAYSARERELRRAIRQYQDNIKRVGDDLGSDLFVLKKSVGRIGSLDGMERPFAVLVGVLATVISARYRRDGTDPLEKMSLAARKWWAKEEKRHNKDWAWTGAVFKRSSQK